MTKKELIELLKDFDDETKICVYRGTSTPQEPVVTPAYFWNGNNTLELEHITIS